MGTWGIKAFENDGASDWVFGLSKGGLRLIENSFDAVLGANGYLESPDCENAIAATEALAFLLTREGTVPEGVSTWAAAEKRTPAPALVIKAKASITKILSESELKDLWAESKEYTEWEADLKRIDQKLASAPVTPNEAKPRWKFW